MRDQDKQPAARANIHTLSGQPGGGEGATLFITHYLEELSSEDWKTWLGVETPSAKQISSALVIVDAWDSEGDGNIDTFDFSLPNAVTNYLISVRFNEDEVESDPMES